MKASGQQLAKFVASDAAADDYFGYSVAISGDLVVVGAYRDDDAGSKTGSAYVFRTTNDGGSWTQTAKLVASDAAATTTANPPPSATSPSSERTGGTKTPPSLASDAAADDYFATPSPSAATSPPPGAQDDDAGSKTGSAYVFRTTNDGGSWTQTAKLVASDAAGDNFGKSAAISGDLAAAGADGRNEDRGDAAAYAPTHSSPYSPTHSSPDAAAYSSAYSATHSSAYSAAYSSAYSAAYSSADAASKPATCSGSGSSTHSSAYSTTHSAAEPATRSGSGSSTFSAAYAPTHSMAYAKPRRRPYYTVRLDGPVPRDVQTERHRLRLIATSP
ncbi:hypothetical protein JL722_14621 [Aureococcus anophagefferens]|nr:hypothetical protein JL722_14621 [Aureococcus anophagefferens]